jgi:hypothetical protein
MRTSPGRPVAEGDRSEILDCSGRSGDLLRCRFSPGTNAGIRSATEGRDAHDQHRHFPIVVVGPPENGPGEQSDCDVPGAVTLQVTSQSGFDVCEMNEITEEIGSSGWIRNRWRRAQRGAALPEDNVGSQLANASWLLRLDSNQQSCG